jgi:hypothetical protein
MRQRQRNRAKFLLELPKIYTGTGIESPQKEEIFMTRRGIVVLFWCVVLVASAAGASELVPFRGTWQGSTVSAVPVAPNVVFVVSSGTGQATHLGRFEMTSPHFTYLDTFTVEGTQDFIAANGDTLTATFSGQLLPNADGCLAGTLPSTITGGTGRFEGATGSYDFHIVACPGTFGFNSTATFEGSISRVGGD